MVDEPLRVDEAQQLEIVVAGAPRRERDERWPQRNARVAQDGERRDDVGPGMPLLEPGEDGVGQRFDRRDDEGATRRAEFGDESPLLEHVLDLRREVVAHVREFVMQRAHELHGVAGTVQEVRVAERDVPGAGRDQPADVRQHDVPRHREEPSTVHGRDGTMQAGVEATATRLHVACRDELPGARQARVPRQGRQPCPARRWERESLQGHPRLDRGLLALVPAPHQGDELLLQLASQHRVGAVGAQVLGIEQRIQAVKDDPARAVQAAHLVGRPDSQPERGVHRDADRHEPRPPSLVGIERLDGEVEGLGRVSRQLEERAWPGQAEWLMTQLVARDQENCAGRAEGAGHFFRNAWSAARKSGVVRLTALTSAPSRMPSSKRMPSSW